MIPLPFRAASKGAAGMLKYTLVIFVMLMLFSGCGGKPYDGIADNEPFSVNPDSDCVKQGDIIYFCFETSFGGSDPKLRFLDVSTGECMPLCGKPNCMHDDADCNASVRSHSTLGFIRLMLYNNRLFWIEAEPPEYILYSIKPDGTDRRRVLTIDKDMYSLAYGKGTAEIHDGVLYICGRSDHISDGIPSSVCVVFSQPLNGGRAKLIYRSDENASIFGGFCGDILYFAESEMWADDKNKPLVLKLFSYNTATGELTELYRGERAEAHYRYLLAADNVLYLAGYNAAAVFSPADKSFSLCGDDTSMFKDIGEGIMLCWESGSSYLCSDMNGAPLFRGTFPPEGFNEQRFGRLYMGSSNNKMYYYVVSLHDDGSSTWHIMEFDLAAQVVNALWEQEVIFAENN